MIIMGCPNCGQRHGKTKRSDTNSHTAIRVCGSCLFGWVVTLRERGKNG